MIRDKIRGVILGAAAGDALGMPVESLSHASVRMYYRGIKAYTGDEKRADLKAGQWTGETQFLRAVADLLAEDPSETGFVERLARRYVALLPEARRWSETSRTAIEALAQNAPRPDAGAWPSSDAAVMVIPPGAWWFAVDADRDTVLHRIRAILSLTHPHPAASAAGFGQAFLVREALAGDPLALDGRDLWRRLVMSVEWAESALPSTDRRLSDRLHQLTDHLHEFPLDLQDICEGTGSGIDQAWAFAAVMFCRNPGLVEATVLSSINVGGDANTVGCIVGSLIGALHGWSAFPEEWKTGLEAVTELEAAADALAARLYG